MCYMTLAISTSIAVYVFLIEPSPLGMWLSGLVCSLSWLTFCNLCALDLYGCACKASVDYSHVDHMLEDTSPSKYTSTGDVRPLARGRRAKSKPIALANFASSTLGRGTGRKDNLRHAGTARPFSPTDSAQADTESVANLEVKASNKSLQTDAAGAKPKRKPVNRSGDPAGRLGTCKNQVRVKGVYLLNGMSDPLARPHPFADSPTASHRASPSRVGSTCRECNSSLQWMRLVPW